MKQYLVTIRIDIDDDEEIEYYFNNNVNLNKEHEYFSLSGMVSSENSEVVDWEEIPQENGLTITHTTVEYKHLRE
jgi:hypothetical protein